MTLFFRNILKYILLAEMVLFLLFYYFGPSGIQAIQALCHDTKMILQEIDELTKQTADLACQIQESKKPFAKEKMARERLLMKKEHEMVYFIKR